MHLAPTWSSTGDGPGCSLEQALERLHPLVGEGVNRQVDVEGLVRRC